MATVLKNKIVVITGGAEGIGYGIANKYLEKQAKVIILLDINEKQGIESAKTLNTKYGDGKAAFFKCDVTTDLDKVYKKITDSYKHVDVLVNNAGIMNDKLIKKTIDVNVTALIEWSLKFWEHMRKDRNEKVGTIVNLASIYGFRVDQFIPVYQASKFAVYGFTKSLGHEYNYQKSGVREIAICPGFVKTKLTSARSTPAPVIFNEDAADDLVDFLDANAWQEVDAVGNAAVEIFERAQSGAAWLIEGSRPIVEVVHTTKCP